MKIDGCLATSSHPGLDHHWQFTAECLDKMAEQLPGLPVRVNFQGEPVGYVDSAARTEKGVHVSIRVLAGEEKRVQGDVFSPSFVARDETWNDDYSLRDINFAEVKEISLTDD